MFSMHRFCSYQITNQTFWLTRSRVKRLKEEVIFLSCLLFCQMIPHRNFFRRSNLERSNRPKSAQIVSNCNRFKHGEYYDSHLKKTSNFVMNLSLQFYHIKIFITFCSLVKVISVIISWKQFSIRSSHPLLNLCYKLRFLLHADVMVLFYFYYNSALQ